MLKRCAAKNPFQASQNYTKAFASTFSSQCRILFRTNFHPPTFSFLLSRRIHFDSFSSHSRNTHIHCHISKWLHRIHFIGTEVRAILPNWPFAAMGRGRRGDQPRDDHAGRGRRWGCQSNLPHSHFVWESSAKVMFCCFGLFVFFFFSKWNFVYNDPLNSFFLNKYFFLHSDEILNFVHTSLRTNLATPF